MTRPVPRFTPEQELGRGATSLVHRVRLEAPWGELSSGTPLALKRPRDDRPGDGPELQGAFEREEAVLSSPELASSQHVVRLVAAGQDEAGPWLLEELLEGPTLRERLRAGRIPEAELRPLGRELAAGLAELHDAGWCHGDIKPENVRQHRSGRAAWLDLGLACAVQETQRKPGRTGGGNLAYLSPEEARGERRTPASEVFSLGLLLYELATGEHPLTDPLELSSPETSATEGDTSSRADELLFTLADPVLPLPSELVPELSPFLDQLLAATLELDPARRPAMAAVREALAAGEESTFWSERRAAAAAARIGSPDWPLVDRGKELEIIGAAAAVASTDGGGLLWIEGGSGTGKTRLVKQALAGIRQAAEPGRAPLVLGISCADWEEEQPGQPVRSLLRRWLGLARGEEPGPEHGRLLESLVSPAVALALTASLAGQEDENSGMSRAAALAEWWLALAAAERQLIVVLDDLHNAGEVTLGIVEAVGEQLPGTRALVLGVLRTQSLPRHAEYVERCLERIPGPGDAAPARRLLLASLGREPMNELVEALFHHTTPRLQLARVLYERTDGNPGQLAELLRSMETGGLVSRPEPDGPLHLLGRPEDVPRPRTSTAAIRSSFLALPRTDRHWLARMAVAGSNFSASLLEQAFDRGRGADLEAILARMVRTGWLLSTGQRYRFARHALREAVLQAIGKGRRRRLHLVAARALRPAGGGRVKLSMAYQLAYHLRGSGRHEEFLEFLPGLVRVALERGHPQRVHSLCSWGLSALDQVEPTEASASMRLELLEAAADSADRLGRLEQQRDWLDRLSDIDLDLEENPLGAGRIYLLHARHAAGTGRYGLARGLFLNAGQLFERAGAQDLESEAWRRMAYLQTLVEGTESARELADKAYDVGRAPWVRSMAAVAMALVDLLEDRYEDALRNVDDARRLVRVREPGPREHAPLAAASLMRARIYRVVGRPGRAMAAVQHAARLARLAGERRLEVECFARLGSLWIDVGKEEEAELRLRDALVSARDMEDGRGEALASLWLGTLLAENDQREGARLIESAESLAGRLGLGRVGSVATALRARVALADRQPELALERSELAMEKLGRHGAELLDRIVIAGTHALCLERTGRTAEAGRARTQLERTIQRTNVGIANPQLRKEHAGAAARALAAATTELGHLVPRKISHTGVFRRPRRPGLAEPDHS